MTSPAIPLRLRVAALFTALLLLSCVVTACQSPASTPVSRQTFLLDTVVKITIYEGGGAQEIADAFALCRRYEDMLSRTKPDSEIARLNARTTTQVSDETAVLIQLGLTYAALSNGALDITIAPVSTLWDFRAKPPRLPDNGAIAAALTHVGWQKVTVDGNTITFADEHTQLDLGAIAKGYIADRLKESLVAAGVTRALINLGGNIQCIGQKSATEAFSVGIQRPFADSVIAVAAVADISMVTSGVYERCFRLEDTLYHHLLDPQTGYPAANDLLSVTIFCANSAQADALSTACFVLGRDTATALIDSLEGVHAVFITDDYRVHLTKDFREAIPISITP